MSKNDCFLYYIIATKLDGTKEVHTFKSVIGAQCPYKYVNMMGNILDLGKFTNRTPHPESSSDAALGNIIHEATERESSSTRIPNGGKCTTWDGSSWTEDKFCEPGSMCNGPSEGSNGICVPQTTCQSDCCRDQYACIKGCGGTSTPGSRNCCRDYMTDASSCDTCKSKYKCQSSTRIPDGGKCTTWDGSSWTEDKFCEPGSMCNGPSEGSNGICVPQTTCQSDCCKDQYACIKSCGGTSTPGSRYCCHSYRTDESSCESCKSKYKCQ